MLRTRRQKAVRTTRTSGVPGPDGHEYDSFVRVDEFARALDGGGYSTSDATLNRELALVATLRRAGTVMAAPEPAERDRMRQRIMAQYSSVVHGGTSPVLPLRESGRRRRISDERRGRFVVAAAAALCLLMSLSGVGLLLSREALPGDTLLYAVKRSAESAALGLTFGDENKALKHLEFAKARVSEIEVMAERVDADATWSAGDDRFVRALDDFERDTAAGTRLLTEVASEGRSAILPSLRGWVEQQEPRRPAVRRALPLAATTRLATTLELLDRVITRVDALDRRSDCVVVTFGTHDDLGLLPARGACEVVPSNGASTVVPLPAAGGAPEPDSADSLVPPGLLAPQSATPIAEPGQSGRLGGLPTDTEGVLPAPGNWDGGSSQPALEEPAAPSDLLPTPLPAAGIPPLLQLLPLENPHVE